MTMSKIPDIEAVAFDIDGTLYPSWKLTVHLIPFFLRNIRFMEAFRKARRLLHKHSTMDPNTALPDFFALQSELLASYLNTNPSAMRAFLDEEVYTGWQRIFSKIHPYPFAYEAVKQLKAAGFKIGILSDFPPEQKGDVWGILPLCDAALNSEATGALKPSHIPFLRLAEALGTSCNRILYVGNSVAYDVAGAAAVGMKTAYIQNSLTSRFFPLKKNTIDADISFSNYRQFLHYVL
ncbi:HAD family hydrolase [Treponema sp.]|uniref:HAD family hydrolase n=1 Tax=Treponema sp. TaxID=166 RepID=UPI003FA30626